MPRNNLNGNGKFKISIIYDVLKISVLFLLLLINLYFYLLFQRISNVFYKRKIYKI